MSTPTLPSSQSASELIQDISSGEVSRQPLEAKSGGRKALPEVIVKESLSFYSEEKHYCYKLVINRYRKLTCQ